MNEAPDDRSRGACLESFRIDASGRAWVYLVPATVAIMLGALGICTAFVSHGVFARSDWYAIVGSASMLAGLTLGALVAWPVITHDEYLAALEGGILWKLSGEEGFTPWSDIARVTWNAERGAVVIEKRVGENVEIVRAFGRMSAAAVAPKLDDFRRKAGFHLL